MPRWLWEAIQSDGVDFLSREELVDILDAKLLVPSAEDELKTVLDENAAHMADNRSLYMVVQPTADCQLGCSYCGQSHVSAQMSEKVQLAFVEHITRKLDERAGHYEELTIGWFGGEPLLAPRPIRTITRYLVEAASKRSLNYRAKLVTNGLALTARIAEELVSELFVDHIEITLDGDQATHDKRRIGKSGLPTFTRIYENLLAVARSDLNVRLSVRCNVDQHNWQSVDRLIRRLAADGLSKRVSFYTVPVYSWGNDAHLSALAPERYAQLEITWLRLMTELDFGDVRILPRRRYRLCIAVDPASDLTDAYGNTFKCTEVSYVPAYGTPNEYDIDSPATATLTGFYDLVQRGDYGCYSCSLLPVCGGGCPKRWAEGTFTCPSHKRNIAERLTLALPAP